eukprot:Hpha_TRINITY_DN2632_c0_g1::TRINITY_DN2632_c0_g1_i1::g.145803::m.145803
MTRPTCALPPLWTPGGDHGPSRPPPRYTLHDACKEGDLSRALRLMQSPGVDVNAKASSRVADPEAAPAPPLVFALYTDFPAARLDLLEALLQAGADPCVPDEDGASAADLADRCKDEGVQSLMRQRGAGGVDWREVGRATVASGFDCNAQPKLLGRCGPSFRETDALDPELLRPALLWGSLPQQLEALLNLRLALTAHRSGHYPPTTAAGTPVAVAGTPPALSSAVLGPGRAAARRACLCDWVARHDALGIAVWELARLHVDEGQSEWHGGRVPSTPDLVPAAVGTLASSRQSGRLHAAAAAAVFLREALEQGGEALLPHLRVIREGTAYPIGLLTSADAVASPAAAACLRSVCGILGSVVRLEPTAGADCLELLRRTLVLVPAELLDADTKALATAAVGRILCLPEDKCRFRLTPGEIDGAKSAAAAGHAGAAAFVSLLSSDDRFRVLVEAAQS